jgi:hypothetical protein
MPQRRRYPGNFTAMHRSRRQSQTPLVNFDGDASLLARGGTV